MPNRLQIRRGLLSALPTLLAGETGFTTDTFQIYVGDGTNNHLIGPPASYVLYANTSIPGGNTNASTNTETPFNSTATILANSLAAGDVIRVTMAGVFGTAIVAPTIDFRVYLAVTKILDTSTLTLLSALSGEPWTATITITVQGIGSSGQLWVSAQFTFATAATTALSVLVSPSGNPFAIDTTINELLSVSTQWGAASASNTITLNQLIVEILKKR